MCSYSKPYNGDFKVTERLSYEYISMHENDVVMKRYFFSPCLAPESALYAKKKVNVILMKTIEKGENITFLVLTEEVLFFKIHKVTY